MPLAALVLRFQHFLRTVNRRLLPLIGLSHTPDTFPTKDSLGKLQVNTQFRDFYRVRSVAQHSAVMEAGSVNSLASRVRMALYLAQDWYLSWGLSTLASLLPKTDHM